MKKSAFFAALLCAVSSGAYAASDVTLYGVVDGAVSVSKVKGQAARVGFDNGIWAGSRFGIKGNEDLGSGYNLGFILEQGFKTFSGDAMNSSKAFARQSTLSLSTPFGTFAAGRTGGLSSDCGTYNILHGSSLWTSYYSTGNIYGTFILSDRMDNVLLYNTPDMNGSTVHFMYSNGMGENGDEQKWSKDDHYYGVGYEYAKGRALFSAMWEMYDHKEHNLKSSQIFTMGGSYDFGSFSLYGASQFAYRASRLPTYAFANELGPKGANQHGFSASIGVPVAGGTAKLQGNYGFGKIKEGSRDYSMYSIALSLIHI